MSQVAESKPKKRLCPTELNIVENIKRGYEDPVISNRALLSMHQTMYHRGVKEFDKQKEFCKVWNVTVDPVTFQELKELAHTEKV